MSILHPCEDCWISGRRQQRAVISDGLPVVPGRSKRSQRTRVTSSFATSQSTWVTNGGEGNPLDVAFHSVGVLCPFFLSKNIYTVSCLCQVSSRTGNKVERVVGGLPPALKCTNPQRLNILITGLYPGCANCGGLLCFLFSRMRQRPVGDHEMGCISGLLVRRGASHPILGSRARA